MPVTLFGIKRIKIKNGKIMKRQLLQYQIFYSIEMDKFIEDKNQKQVALKTNIQAVANQHNTQGRLN